MEIKEILYNSINRHSKHIISNIAQGRSLETINTIFEECLPLLENLEGNKHEIFGSFSESLFHYLLTTAMIPSQRKTVFNGIYIDVSIPDTKTLNSAPQDVLIIIFPKTNDVSLIKNRVYEISKIQPNKENVWLVLSNNFPIETKIYCIEKDNTNSFANILNDIISFLTNKKQSKLKLFSV